VAACVAGGSAPAAAQSGRFDGQEIREVEYVGLKALPAETLDYYLFGGPIEPGRRLDTADLDDRIKTLWDRELIDDVKVEAEPADGGVRLIVRVVERPVLLSVDYVGIKRVSRSDINEQIDRERISVFENQPLNLGELQRLKLAIESLYKEKGFRFAEVRYTLEEAGPGQRRAIFTIDEGNKVKIGDVNFDGNTVFGDWRLRRAMKKTKESGLISRFTKKDIYNPANIEEDLEGVRDLYRRAGYKDVLIARPEINVEARRPDAPTIAEQKRRLLVTIPVEEGERWRLGAIRVAGNEVFGEQILLRQFEQPRGGWLRSKAIDDGVEKIDKLYKSVGYIFAQIRTEVEEVSPGVADVVVRIDERDQFRVGRMEFEGNTKTRDKVLRREMFVQESTVMNMTSIQSSLLRIRQLNYFALDEEEPIQFEFDAEEKTVDLKVQGEEAERTELQFGGGWSEVDGFFGQFAIRTTNFRGRGETLGVSVQSGRQRDLYDLEYRVPWFLDRPQNVAFRIFSQNLDTRILTGFDFEQKYAGASLTYGRNLRGFQSMSFTYSFTDFEDLRREFLAPDDPRNDPDDPDDDVREQVADFKISSIIPVWVRNTLDSRYEPTRGLLTQGSIEIAGGPLGGESSYYRPRFEMTWFKALGRRPVKSSFGVHAEAGLIETYEGSGLFPQQRFFLGGEASVRGFRTRTIVARATGDVPRVDGNGDPVLDPDGNPIVDHRPILFDEDGFPLGGDTTLQFSLEYHLIMGGPFRVVLFGDAGGVFTSAGTRLFSRETDEEGNLVPKFTEDQTFDLGLMRYSAGVELRIMVPLFPAPLRFIYATNIDPLPGDRFESFDFSLSTSF
jgi:outer membrane protein insertion porin family